MKEYIIYAFYRGHDPLIWTPNTTLNGEQWRSCNNYDCSDKIETLESAKHQFDKAMRDLTACDPVDLVELRIEELLHVYDEDGDLVDTDS